MGDRSSLAPDDRKLKLLSGKVAIVTGAGSGIGRATARKLAEQGAAIAAMDREVASLSDVTTELQGLGGGALSIEVDLSDAGAIPFAVQRVLSEFGRTDVLVNAAGFGQMRTMFEVTREEMRYMMAVNAWAPLALIQEVSRDMIDRKEGGRIVNVTSSAAFRATSPIHYSASKAALTAITRVAAAELAPFDINVNAVAPGLTNTTMARGVRGEADSALRRAVIEGTNANLFGRLSEPEDVAAIIEFLCLPESRQITAQTIHASAGNVL